MSRLAVKLKELKYNADGGHLGKKKKKELP